MFEVPGLAPGHYRASLLANEGMTELARAEFVVPPPLTLTVSPATVPAEGSSATILVEWSGIPNPMPGDWLGIYPAGVAPHGFAVGNPLWKYVDCQQHVGAGVQPVAAGVCTFEVPWLAPGQYRASLLANEGMTELANAVFTVEAGTRPQPPPPSEPKLILLTQSALHDTNGSEIRAWPSYIATRVAHIETLPFDGIAIHNPIGTELMNGSLHSVASIANEWAPLKGVTWTRMQHNFAVVHVKRPADFFDDWTNTIQSFQNLAIVLRDVGIQGILFDNEEYSTQLWTYPTAVSYSGTKTLAEYQAQARLRGGQIITAVQAVYPDVQFMVLLSPSENCASTPSIVRSWTPTTNRLTGAFTVGLMEQSNKPIIDGNEVGYAYRSQAEFDAAYTWNKTGMAGCPFIPASFASTYPWRVSVSAPVYNQQILYANNDSRPMSPQIMSQVLPMAIRGVDEYAWLYWEGANWYNPIGSTYGVPTEWLDSIRQRWLETKER